MLNNGLLIYQIQGLGIMAIFIVVIGILLIKHEFDKDDFKDD